MNTLLPVCGAILAGGKSARMGRPKHALKLSDGRTMIERVADALRGACGNDATDEIIILGPDSILTDVNLGRARCIPDKVAGHFGPLAGIEALLSSGIAEHYLICACDTPLLTANLLLKLRVATAKTITMFRFEGAARCEPAPMRLAASALPTARRRLQSEDRSIHSFAYAVPHHEVMIGRSESSALRNLNTPEEFQSM